MIVAPWLAPIYEDIPSILVGLPVRLSHWGDILASGNMHSTWSDATDGIPGPDNLPFASVRRVGAGFVVLICGNVSADVWLEGCPHNTRWLVNLCQFLVADAAGEKRRLTSYVLSSEDAFLSHPHADGARVKGVLAALRSEHGLRAWLDNEQLFPGDELTAELLDAVGRATMFVLFWSAAASRSQWVAVELEAARRNKSARLIVIRLDDTPLPATVADLLHIDGSRASDAEIAKQVSASMQSAQRRTKLAELRAGARALAAATADAAGAPTATGATTLLPPSLTRALRSSDDPSIAQALPPVRETNERPDCVDTIRSSYRIDVLSFVDGATLHAGSGTFNADDVARAKRVGLIADLVTINCPTGMDGSFSDHRSTRRHIHYGYHSVTIVYRTDGTQSQAIECDPSASVRSAAFSPDGESLVIASDNYLTIARSDSKVVLHENKNAESITSVAWQPSLNPIYAAKDAIVIVTPEGARLWNASLAGPRVVCVAVSWCGRFIACSKANGDVLLWNERGVELLSFRGAGGSAYWHASRGLAFSPDSRFLAQAGNVDSEGFTVYDLREGLLRRFAERDTDLVAWNDARPGLLATAGNKRVSFWQFT